MRQFIVYPALLLTFGIVSAANPSNAAPFGIARSGVDDVSLPEVLLETQKKPVYPRNARRLHLSAQVIIQVMIDSSGGVVEATPVRTKVSERTGCENAPSRQKEKDNKGEELRTASKEFEAAAIKAIKQWRYRPAIHRGVPTTVLYSEVVNFDYCPDKPSR